MNSDEEFIKIHTIKVESKFIPINIISLASYKKSFLPSKPSERSKEFNKHENIRLNQSLNVERETNKHNLILSNNSSSVDFNGFIQKGQLNKCKKER